MKTTEYCLENDVNTPENAPLNEAEKTLSDDFTQALTSARIAFYDNFRSAPRVTEIAPTSTAEFIENLATTIYTQAQQAGGSIPYTVIREVSENFIHAQFREVVVSIFEHGNTIRFSDQGPGIAKKDMAQMPGFSSATNPMKRYIRGVGSGLPLVKEYLSFSHGRITIEDNLNQGSVITISVVPEEEIKKEEEIREKKSKKVVVPHLSDREKDTLYLFKENESLRLTDIKNELELSPSTVYRLLDSLEQQGLIETVGKIRVISDYGIEVAEELFG